MGEKSSFNDSLPRVYPSVSSMGILLCLPLISSSNDCSWSMWRMSWDLSLISSFSLKISSFKPLISSSLYFLSIQNSLNTLAISPISSPYALLISSFTYTFSWVSSPVTSLIFPWNYPILPRALMTLSTRPTSFERMNCREATCLPLSSIRVSRWMSYWLLDWMALIRDSGLDWRILAS